MIIQELILPAKIERGAILRICSGTVCLSFKITRLRAGRARVAEVAGSLAVDPMIAYYEQRLAAGELPKVARAKACKKFKLGRSQFFNRRAAR
jgi:hypothetical protein